MSYATFSLSSFWTWRLTRLNIKGFRIMWRRRSWCSFNLLPLFSAAFSMSLENHSLNSSWESKRLGIIKCKRAHNSSVNKIWVKAVIAKIWQPYLASSFEWVCQSIRVCFDIESPREFSILHLMNFWCFELRPISCIAIWHVESIVDLVSPIENKDVNPGVV